MKGESSVIHFQGQNLGSCDFGLLQREAESSRLVGRGGVPTSRAVVGTGVWPGISSEFCVLSVKAGRLSPGLDRERLPGTWPWKPRWAPLADSLLSWWVSAGEVPGSLLCVVQQTVQPAESLGTLFLPRDPDCLGWGAALIPLALLPITSFRHQLVQGAADTVHAAHPCAHSKVLAHTQSAREQWTCSHSVHPMLVYT